MHSAETLSQSSEPGCVETWLLGIKPLKTSTGVSSKRSLDRSPVVRRQPATDTSMAASGSKEDVVPTGSGTGRGLSPWAQNRA